MKKILLSLFTLASFGALAQTHSALSGNQEAPNADGYEYNFNGTIENNCGPEPGFLDVLNSTKFNWELGSTSGTMVLRNEGSGNGFYATMKNNKSDCNGTAQYSHIEVAAPCTVRISCKATVAGGDLIVHLNGTSGGYAQGADVTYNGIATDDFHYYEFVFTSAEAGTVPFAGGSFTDIEGLGLATAFPGGVAGNLEIDWIEIGSTVGSHTTGINDAQLDATLVAVYPTPAKEVLNVDLSRLTGATDLKLMSSTGGVVYSTTTSSPLEVINVDAFNKGLYVLQITSNGKTTTKKVVLN